MASVGPSAASTQPALPSGPAVFKTIPYAFILPEIVSTPRSAACRHPLLAKMPRTHPEGSITGKWHLVLDAQSIPQGLFRDGLRTRLHRSLREGHGLPWGWERLESCWLTRGRRAALVNL